MPSFRAGLCAPILGGALCAHSGQASGHPFLAGLGGPHGQVAVRTFWARFWASIRIGLCTPIPVRHLFYVVLFVRAHPGQASVRPFWAGLPALVPGKPLCAHSGQASVRPLRAGLCMSVHSGQTFVRPLRAVLCAPILGRFLCSQSGQDSGRPAWAGFCAAILGRPLSPILGRPLCAHLGRRRCAFWAGLGGRPWPI